MNFEIFLLLFKLIIFFTCFLPVTGPNAVEFIINHAEMSIAFVQENKIPSVSSYSQQIILESLKVVILNCLG